MTALSFNIVLAIAAASPAATEDIRRLPVEGVRFPISAAVSIPAGMRTLHVSGVLPDVADQSAPGGTPAAYGSTEVQTRSVIDKIAATLARGGMSLRDIVSMRVFLVGDPNGGRLDFAGMMKAYSERFGTVEQPALPARTVVQVVALPLPGAAVEIDVIAARHD